MPLAEGNPMRAAVLNYVGLLQGQIDEWNEGIRKHERGTDFRKGLGDAFVVFVFGKVKAGKSSLGNYIAWGASEWPIADALRQVADPPRFKGYSESRDAESQGEIAKLEQRQCFGVAPTRATGIIQTFTLPGFTWVDSPGIHALRAEDEALAKNYVGSADLVIYPMSSSEPGLRSDIEEVLGLLQERKSLILLLTRSDETVPDEDADGRIVKTLQMKPLADRQAQVEDVGHRCLGGLSPEQQARIESQIIPISVRYAELHQGDPERMRDSGLPALFQRMEDIADGRSVQLKLRTPLDNLRRFAEQVRNSLGILSARLAELEQQLSRTEAGLERDRDEVSAAVRRAMSAEITAAVQRFRGDSHRLQAHLSQALGQQVSRQAGAAIARLLQGVDGAVANVLQVGDIGDLPGFSDRYAETRTSNAGKTRAVGQGVGTVAGAWGGTEAGVWAGAALGSVVPGLGTAVGAVVGGFIGGALGGWGGNRLGDKAGEAASGYTVHRIVIGDNLDEVEASARRIYHEAAERLVAEVMENVFRGGLNALRDFAASSRQGLAAFDSTLQQEVLA